MIFYKMDMVNLTLKVRYNFMSILLKIVVHQENGLHVFVNNLFNLHPMSTA